MSSPSASPALSCGKRKRKSVPTPRTLQAIVPAGTDLSILVKPKEFGGIVHQLQPAIIPEIISRFGFGWQCAAINKELPLVILSWKHRLLWPCVRSAARRRPSHGDENGQKIAIQPSSLCEKSSWQACVNCQVALHLD